MVSGELPVVSQLRLREASVRRFCRKAHGPTERPPFSIAFIASAVWNLSGFFLSYGRNGALSFPLCSFEQLWKNTEGKMKVSVLIHCG